MTNNYFTSKINWFAKLKPTQTNNFVLFILTAFFYAPMLNAQVVQTYTSSGSWICPNGVISVQVETWGSGGGGGYARTINNGAGGGGGGGEYTTSTIPVTPGVTYYYKTGIGGIGGTAAGVAATSGQASCFSTISNCGGVILASANGGNSGGSVVTNAAGTAGTGGNGGVFTSGLSFVGGNGAVGLNGNGAAFGGGGGGGGASTSQAGGNAIGKIGGTGGSIGGGNGGNGGTNLGGAVGNNIGGGGAGGHRNNANNAGGGGGNGQVRLTYTLPICTLPLAQPTSLIFGATTTTSIAGTFSAAIPAADKYLVVVSTSATAPSPSPADNTTYSIGSTIGTGTVVSLSSSTNFTASTLTPGVQYYFYVYSYNDTLCTGPVYQSLNPLSGSQSTICSTATTIGSNSITTTSANITWTGSGNYILEYGAPGFTPGIGAASGAGGTIASSVAASPFTLIGLTVGTTYQIYLRQVCPLGGFSANATAYTFTTACALPTSQPTVLTFGTITTSSIAGSFTAASPAPNKYLVVVSTSATAPNPLNNTSYLVGGNLGGAIVVSISNATSFTASGLIAGTQYYFYIFSYNDTSCTGPVYLLSGALTGSRTTPCNAGSAVTANSITTNSANITWTGSGNYIVEYGTTGFTPGIGVAAGAGGTIASSNATTPFLLSGLNVGTTYQIYVRQVCPIAGYSANSSVYTFTTACATPSAQPTSLTFGTVTSTSIAGAFTAASPAPNKYLVAVSTSATAPIPINNTTYTVGGVLGSATIVSISNATSFTASGLTSGTLYYFYIFSYNDTSCAGPVYLVSSALTGNRATPCNAGTAVTANNITGNSANITWTGTGNFVIEYGATGFVPGTGISAGAGGTIAATAANTPFGLGGLTASTTYQVYVRQLCPLGGYSANSTVYSFTTACAATNIPYTQNFESATLPAIPVCNSIQNAGTGNNWITSNNPGYGFATKTLQYNFNATNAANSWYFTQGLNLTAGVSYRLTYRYGSTGATFPENLKVAYGSVPSSGSMISTLATHNSISTINNSNFVDFVPSTTGIYYIGFNAFSVANRLLLLVDDINVSISPTCIAPTLNPSTNLTSTSATINWNAPPIPPSNGYEYIISTINATPIVAGTSTLALSANAISLTANTNYFVYVRSDCGGGNYSSWTTAGTFFTGFCTATSTNTTRYISNFSTSGGFANITNNGSGFSASGYGNFTAQTVSQQPYGTVNFSSTYAGGIFGFGFTIWVDWNNDLDFNDAGEKVYGSGSYNTNNTGNFTVPGSANVGNHRMRIRADYNSTTPASCGLITNGETEDYTFVVVALPCGGNPSNISASPVAQTTVTVNWNAASPAPTSGYQYYFLTSTVSPVPATIPSGSVGAGVTSANLSGLTPATTYNFWIRSNCGANQGVWIGPLTFLTTIAAPVTTSTTVCQGGSSSLGATAICTSLTNLGNTINGGWDATADPRAIRPIIFITNANGCAFEPGGFTSNYTSLDFQVSTTGSYTFTMANTALYDAMGYIVVNPFTPGQCGSGTWVTGDDDSGPTALEPQMNAILNAGTTYTLITTLYSGSSITLTNTYQWNITGPGTISALTNGALQWYTAAVGGSPIATGATFNPVGVSGSGLINTSTPGTTTYYAACPSNPSIRTPANFIVNGPTSSISCLGSICSGNTSLSIAFTGSAPWTFTYTDGTTPVTVTGNSTNPYVVAVFPTVATSYSITALNDANCTALAANRGGTGTIANSKTWNGSTSNWNTAANWSPIGVPTAFDCVVIPNVAVGPIISGSSYNAYAYNLTVLNGGILQINSTNNLTVTDVVNVNVGGQFLIKDAASLLQINNINNVGIINLERITQKMYRFDYTYWGCPVTLSSNFTLGALSPNTLSDKYFSWIPTVGGNFGTWSYETSATIMDPSKGYIVRAPQTFPFTSNAATNITYTANFIGTPNNGNILSPILHGTLGAATNNDKYNLLGNPYPSAVNAELFLSDPANVPVIDGTIYFWTHNSPPSTAYADPFYGDFVINYTATDYASWNKLGGTGTTAAATSGGAVPNGFIAAGQGFFTRSTGTAPSGNPAIFKNTMRVAGNNNQFFRGVSNSNTATNAAVIEKHRIWLNLINISGAFNQILVGYVEGGTNGWDRNFDGIRFNDNSISLYSVIPEQNLVIQGRGLPFNIDDQVTLGYKSTMQDTFSLRLDHFDGLFDTQNIYIEDKLLHIIHNIKESPYVFTSGIGTFNNRFVLRYNDTPLETVNPENAVGVTALIFNEELWVQASENILQITLFDITGKLIIKENPTNLRHVFKSGFNYAEGVYMIKIKLENGNTMTEKLVNRK